MDPEPGGTTPEDAEAASCENCEARLIGPFCAVCGQPSRSPITSVRVFVAHALDDVASLDSRLARSLYALLFRPGFLTREYLRGHRVRYTQPVTLYLLAAAAFFFTASLRPFLWFDTGRRQVVGALPGLTVGGDVGGDKLRDLEASGVSLELFAERFADTVSAFLPAFLVGSVALFSLVLHALYFRRERRYLPHAVFALHWTAFYLVVLAAARLLPIGIAQLLPLVVGLVYLSIAVHRVWGQGILPSVLKGTVLLFAFLVMLASWVAATTWVGLLVT